MYKYRGVVVEPIEIKGRIWFDKGQEVDVESQNGKSVNIRVSKFAVIAVSPSSIKEVPGTGRTE